jgi:serine protease inhibitor
VESVFPIRVTTQGTNRLAVRLLAQLGADPWPNLLLSPCSLAFCLAVLLNGAAGDTRTALVTALGLEQFAEEEVNLRFQDLRVQVLQIGPHVAVDLATAVWAPPGAALNEEFLQRVRQAFAAEVRALEAVGPAGAEMVNRWASSRTSGRITELVGPGALTAGSACVLTDVIYFRGTWAVPFDPERTGTALFTLPNGQRRNVPMMTRSGRYPYLATEEFQAVALDYADGRLCMVVLLPSKTTEPITSVWDQLTARMDQTDLDLTMPRFSVTCELDLVPPLAGLGLASAFEPSADFSRMGLPGAYIQAWRHTARIDVDEKGTEAAAGTAVIMGRSLRASMVVDHPFYLAVFDNRSGLCLFLGRVTAP